MQTVPCKTECLVGVTLYVHVAMIKGNVHKFDVNSHK